MRIEQAPEKRVEQHASWIAINPVIGCPYNCEYCFLGPDNLRPKRPDELREPDAMMQDLLESKYYAPDIPVAIGTYTDMFATPKNQNYVRSWLDVWKDAELGNPLVFITKGEIPDDIAETMGGLHASGLPIVAFLSISGLGREIEKGVKHEKLFQNIGRLALHNVPVVHYWRPLMPQNSTPEVIERVHSLVAGRTTSSFVGGLRLTEAMKKQIINWPDILEIYTEDLDSAWDKDGYDRVSELRADRSDHPIYEAVSCTMANATQIAEYNGIHGTDMCARSNCPATQRAICGAKRPIPWEKINDTARRLQFESQFDVDTEDRILKIKRPLDVDELTNATHATGMQIKTDYVVEGHYPWGTHHTRESVFISSTIPVLERPKQLLGLSLERLQRMQEEYKQKVGVEKNMAFFGGLVGRLADDCMGFYTLNSQERMVDLKPDGHSIARWQSIYATHILFNTFNLLSCVDMKIDQTFVDRATAYTPHPDGWRFDILNAFFQLQDVRHQTALYVDDETNDINAMYEGDFFRGTLLADLVGSVVYGYKELNLGNISMTKGQLVTRLQDIVDYHDKNKQK